MSKRLKSRNCAKVELDAFAAEITPECGIPEINFPSIYNPSLTNRDGIERLKSSKQGLYMY